MNNYRRQAGFRTNTGNCIFTGKSLSFFYQINKMSGGRIVRFSLILFFIIILFSCRKDESEDDNYLKSPACINSFIPKASEFKVVGFYPSWRQDYLNIENIQWEKLTRIVYAFAIPNMDGTLNTSSLTKTKKLIDTAHSHGVAVYFSVGGGDGSNNFAWIASEDESIKRFVKEIKQYLFENCFDGVDIDWEYWSGYRTNAVVPAESATFVNIMKLLKDELKPFGLGLSIDVGATHWSGKHFYTDAVQYIDDVQIMCYDFTGPWSAPGPHSSFEQSIGSGSSSGSTGLAYWINYRKWPKEKILLGVPFYGRDFDNQGGEGITYSDIIKLSPDAYLNDRINNIYYDGIVTMSRKAQYVVDNNLSGIMIWEIAQDSKEDSTSLLSAIDRTINP
jgi:chitinase